MPEAKCFTSIEAIGREAWDSCFPEELENYDYFVAIERSHIPNFTHVYYAIMEGETLLAAVPAFFTNYDLSTTADGMLRTLLKPIRLKLACIGSALTETCPIAIHPDCHAAQKQELFAKLMQFFDADTKKRGIHLLAFKDMNDANKELFNGIMLSQKFSGIAGMPSAILDIDFTTMEDYMASFSAATRKDMRRKLRKKSEVRIEYRRNIDDVIDHVYAMYLETKSRSDLQFEELTPDYFREVLASKQGLCALYYKDSTLIGANLMLANNECLLDKFFCMKTDIGQEYNLYFISWFANVQYCLDHGLKFYQSGQAGYETKLRLGSRLLPNHMYYRHRNVMLNGLLKLASPLLAFDVPN